MNVYCECCGCDPCDCHGVNDELWRMDKTGSDQEWEDPGMVGEGDRHQPVSGQPMANRNDTAHRILLEDLQRDCKDKQEASPPSHPKRGFLYWGFF